MVVVVFNKLIYCIRLTNYMVEGIARIKAHHLSTSLGKSLRLFSRPGLHKVLLSYGRHRLQGIARGRRF
jgi:hypothetical protein